MIGHGGPKTSRTACASTVSAAATRWGWGSALLFLVLAAYGSVVAEEPMRVRVAWGGGSERLWEGVISLSQGTLSEPRPLGIEADEPGSMWLDDGRLMVRQRTARAYDGVDLLVTAPEDARLLVELTAADRFEAPGRIEVPLAGLFEEFYDKPLDARGNRLLVRPAPGDRLRVDFSGNRLVFEPGEAFRFTLRPHLFPLSVGSTVRIRARLVAAGGQKELWSAERDVHAGQPVAIPLEVNLPQQEGVYEVLLTATRNAGWQEAVRSPLRPLSWNKTVAERKVQLLVLSPKGQTLSIDGPGELHRVVEIDPANPRWWERLAKLPQVAKIPRLWKGPLGNGCMKVRQHPLGKLVELSPNSESPDVSWEAYTLPVSRPGRPHVLEVDYPSDVPQTMGISILEPNAAGALMPIGLDSGVDCPAQLAGGDATPRWLRHRLIFWPRTTSPMVLLSNRREHSSAVYGKIRVLAGWDRLPPAPAAEPRRQSERLFAAYLDRPLFPENFSACESLDRWSGRSLDDWTTFYQGGTRLVEYLHHVGYNGLVLSVLADGSTIYPSEILEPTPRYDTGVFFSTAQDPVRKDVLEMLLRLFDRAGLQLIPAIEFAAPLPELEAVRREGTPGSEAVEWIGPDGATWCQTHPTRRGLAPYYNVLQPRVQEAMLAVVQELIGRYGRHPSFAGLAIQLSAHGYAQLPGADWGMDDATIARFERDTQQKVPGVGPERFARRAGFLTGESRRLWLDWRAEQLSRFYRRVHNELTAIRPGSRLYLTGAAALAGTELQNDLRPALPQRTTIADALLRVGIDARHYRDIEGLVFLRPERITPSGNLNAQAVNLEIGRMPDLHRYFRGLSTPGSLFFHQPQEIRIESFDRKSPFKPAYTWLVSQPVPSDWQNRRRFVHSLATLDCQAMVDGGWLLPLGQEESIRNLVAAYRCLPAVRFEEVGSDSSQPVTFRYVTQAAGTFVYAVNDAAFKTTARVRVAAPAGCRLKELTGTRQVAPLKREGNETYWTVELAPYDLVAVRLSAPGVRLSEPQVMLPGAVETVLGQRIEELGARAASLRNPPPLVVLDNPGFEREPAGESQLPGWVVTRRPGVTIGPDKLQRRSGDRSAKISSNGPVACLVSRPFSPPATGRLSMSVWLRAESAARQPPLRLALEGKLGAEDYYRFAQVGLALGGAQGVVPIGTSWAQYVFQVDDLPLQRLTQLRVRFDLMGAGEVWLDDVQLFDLCFSSKEVTELSKLITLAHVTLRNGQVGDCVRLLEGYWPRFLEENVPLQPGVVPLAAPTRNPTTSQPPAAKESPRTGFLDRIRNLLPR